MSAARRWTRPRRRPRRSRRSCSSSRTATSRKCSSYSSSRSCRREGPDNQALHQYSSSHRRRVRHPLCHSAHSRGLRPSRCSTRRPHNSNSSLISLLLRRSRRSRTVPTPTLPPGRGTSPRLRCLLLLLPRRNRILPAPWAPRSWKGTPSSSRPASPTTKFRASASRSGWPTSLARQ